MTNTDSTEQTMPTREDVERQIENEFDLERRAGHGWMLSSCHDFNAVVSALVDARLSLAKLQKEREKELREAFEEGWAAHRRGGRTPYQLDSEFAAFLKQSKEGK